jgi:hypothetical protein
VSGPVFAEGLPVLRIEIPRAASGFIAIHQHAMLAPQFTVEKLHPQLLPARSVAGELLARTKEMPVGSDLEIHAQCARGAFEAPLHAPFARLDPDQALRAEAAGRGGQLATEVAAVRGVIELAVVNRSTPTAERIAEMPHGAQEHRNARLVRPHVGAFLGDFRHPHRIARRIETVEGGRILVQLVAEDQHQVTRAGLGMKVHARPVHPISRADAWLWKLCLPLRSP